MSATDLVDVVIVGGGPAGLTAAVALREQGVGAVVVLERECEAGGVPRHTDHIGYGMRDLRRLMKGPAYTAALRRRAEQAGVQIRTSTTAVDWVAETSLQTADPDGLSVLAARAVVLATGVRERPRAARLIPGDRGSGIFTTGSLQQLTTIHHQRPGQRAVIVGAEHVSFSAVLTLRHAGCEVVAMITPLGRHQTYAALRAATAGRHRVPIITSCDIASIHGHDHVDAVVLTDGRRIECDTVVFTGDWIPDHELARRGGIEIDAAHRGPLVDGGFRTTRPGTFCIGNLIHPAETADVCALDGRRVASSVLQWLGTHSWPDPRLRLVAEAPITWVSPSLVQYNSITAGDRLIMRVGEPSAARTVSVSQGTSTLWWGRPRGQLVPNRSISIPADALSGAHPEGPAILVSLQP